MKTLITGMTSPQSSRSYAQHNSSFAGLLAEALNGKMHEVEMYTPSFDMTKETLEHYDLVFVGLSAFTGVAANYAYGALWVINELRDSPRLRFFIDAPDPGKIVTSLRAIEDAPTAMLKPFYSARPLYATSREPAVAAKLFEAVKYLCTYTWAETIYPILPWGNHGRVMSTLMPNMVDRLRPINLDGVLFDRLGHREVDPVTDSSFWVADDLKSQWTTNVLGTLKVGALPMKEHKGWTDKDVLEQMSRSRGALIAPSKSTGSWWTPRVAQAIYSGIPIVTDWRESAIAGDCWMDLAAVIDEMSPARRNNLIAQQRDNYLASITPRNKILEYLLDVLLLSGKR